MSGTGGGETIGRYYYNYRTGESTWNKPDALQVTTFIRPIDRPFQFQHIPFKNPYKSKEGSQIPAPVVSEQTASPGTVPDGEVTGYSPPVTADFQLPGEVTDSQASIKA